MVSWWDSSDLHMGGKHYVHGTVTYGIQFQDIDSLDSDNHWFATGIYWYVVLYNARGIPLALYGAT